MAKIKITTVIMGSIQEATVDCDPEAHYSQIEFYGECSWCNGLDEVVATAVVKKNKKNKK